MRLYKYIGVAVCGVLFNLSSAILFASVCPILGGIMIGIFSVTPAIILLNKGHLDD